MEEATVNAGGDEIAARQRRSRLLMRVLRYLLVALFGLAIVWVPTLLYLVTAKDMYRSHWSVIIPGAGVGSSLNIDEIGQATTSVASPYASSSVDPKVNYKAIVTTSTVLGAAAERAEMTSQEYGLPKIKLIDQTSIMQLTFENETAEGAQKMSRALYDSLEAELARLRDEERRQIQQGHLVQLEEYQENVVEAQANLLDFQSSSQLASSSQLTASLAAIDSLESRRSELLLRLASNGGRRDTIARVTDVPAARAPAALKLRQDQQLREHQTALSALTTELTTTQSTLGRNNPRVQSLRSQVNSLYAAIHARSEVVLDYRDESFTNRLLAPRSTDGSDVQLTQVSLEADLFADRQELDELDAQLAELRMRLPAYSRAVARLDELTRAYQVAETIYLSTLAKQDLGRSDVFASYPMIQLLVPPTLPKRPEKLHRLFAVAGAMVGSFFVLLSIVILWKRNALLRRLSRSA